MKVTPLILLTFIGQSFANDLYSQTTYLSLHMSNETVKNILAAIEDQTDYYFMYDAKNINVNQEITVSFEKLSILEALDKIFANTDVIYRIDNRQIALTKRDLVTEGQQFVSISGKITELSGAPLPGVTVLLKGTNQGTITNLDGNYTITDVSSGDTLVFSYIGYISEEIPVGSQREINIELLPNIETLQEVVVIGYGTRKKSDVISSVASVKADELAKTPSSDVGEMLRGKATGVLVTTSDASPGSSTNILIRGKRSITGGNSPIVIVDGVQVQDINDVNAHDISSMEILKDAAAQAIYGARASNGVILITTKRGQAGKMKVNYNGYYGAQKVQQHFDTYSGPEFVAYKREAYRADNNDQFLPDDQVFTSDELATIASGDYIDWQKEILQIAPITDHNLSISAGSKNSSIYSSIDYLGQEGIIKGSQYQRVSVRLNADHVINTWLKAGINTSWQIAEKDYPGGDVTYSADDRSNDDIGKLVVDAGNMLVRSITTSPLGQIYNDDGTLKIHPSGIQDSFNPLLELQEITDDTHDKRTIMNVFVDITPFKGFKYRLNASQNSSNRKNIAYYSGKSLPGIQAGGQGLGSVSFNDDVSWQIENIVTYDFGFKDDRNNLNLTFVQSWLKQEVNKFTNSSGQFPNDAIGMYNLAAAGINQPGIEGSERDLISYVGRAQYNFGGKYYLTVSARADGSSVFGENNKWGYFPAVGAGWNIYRENFLKDSKTVNLLKLRLSYGSVGNEGIAPYQSLSTVNQYDYLSSGNKVAGLLPGSFLPNPDLKWETSTTFNAALDFGLFTNIINGSVEFYNTRTKDLLVDKALVSTTGYTTTKTNVGEIENRGIELTLNGAVVRSHDFNLNLGVTFNANKNKIISLYGIDLDGDGKEDDDVSNNWFIGQPIDVYYDYKAIGIWQTGDDIASSHTPDYEPGDPKLWDRDPTDGELNTSDKVIIRQDPDWFGTFNLDMDYKGFDLSARFYTVQGVTKRNAFLIDYWTGGSLRGVLAGVKQNYWTPENPSNDQVRPKESGARPNFETMGYQDASFFRLQNLTLGYTLPQDLLNRLKMANIRIYVTGHNLITVTDYLSFSPDNDADSYPETISVVGGIQIGF